MSRPPIDETKAAATGRRARSRRLAASIRSALILMALPLTAAGAPDPAPSAAPSPVRFVNVARQAGLTVVDVNGEVDRTTINETVGHGVCLRDVDGDGRLDIYLPNGLRTRPFAKGSEPRSTLYRNRGDGTFEDITTRAGVGAPGYWAQGCVFGDVDDDGRPDLFVTGFGRYWLYRNLGEGRFADVTAAAGLSGGRGWSTGAAFGDYDGDGRLDLYVAHYVDYDASSPPLPLPGAGVNCFYRGFPVICGPRGLKMSSGRLFHNEGNGRFRDVTRASGMPTGPTMYGLGVVWSDFDLDGDLDLYIASDSTAHFLFRNDGRGRFSEVGTLAGVAYNEEGRAQAGMGVDAGDFDNDGDSDLIVSNFSHDYSTLYRNEGKLFFQDVSLSSGFGPPTLPTLGWGLGFLDYDGDGLRDIFLANGHVYPQIDGWGLGTTWKERSQLFHNDGGGRFHESSGEAGPAFQEMHSARGCAFGDLDDDGDVDIVVSNMDEPPSLLRNDGGNARHWVGFRLVGSGRNVDAIGGRVTVIAGGLRQSAEIHAGSSHLSSNDPRLVFGLGSTSKVERAEIRWPGGPVQVLGPLPADRYHTITEPRR